MKRVKVQVVSPGSQGELQLPVTEHQLQFLKSLAVKWNTKNDSHHEPLIRVIEE